MMRGLVPNSSRPMCWVRRLTEWFSGCELSALLFVLGVADGVGGWRAYGIDPGEFSYHLMRTCEHLVRLGKFSPNNPSDLIAKSYYELLHHKKAIMGE